MRIRTQHFTVGQCRSKSWALLTKNCMVLQLKKFSSVCAILDWYGVHKYGTYGCLELENTAIHRDTEEKCTVV